jgi:hypothetical protein
MSEGLLALLNAYKEMPIFTPEDVELVQEEIDSQKSIDNDEEIQALQTMLPQRMEVIERLDQLYGLTKQYPLLMSKIAQRESSFHILLKQKIEEKQQLIKQRRCPPTVKGV